MHSPVYIEADKPLQKVRSTMSSTALALQSLLPALSQFHAPLQQLPQGSNLLVEQNGTISLLKFEGFELETLRGTRFRHNRHCVIDTSLSDWFSDVQGTVPARRRPKQKLTGNVLGTHCIQFTLDPELGIYLPHSDNRDLYLPFAEELNDGEVICCEDPITIVFEFDAVCSRLREIARPRYFTKVLLPFLEGRPTRLKMPKSGWFSNRFTLQQKFAKATEGMDDGAFVYVGCKQEVYLMGVIKNYDGSPFFQGTYTASSRPPLYFSNNYLGHFSKHDVKKRLWRGEGMVNVAKYRISSPAGFAGTPFIFTQMGRRQNCKNTVFTGDPDIITGDVGEALKHFAHTDFAEFADVVERYAATMENPPPHTLNCSQSGSAFIQGSVFT